MKHRFLAFFFLIFFGSLSASENLLRNGDFEAGLAEWTLPKDNGMSTLSPEAAHSGKNGIRIKDDSEKSGSSLLSGMAYAGPGKRYQLSFWGRIVDNDAGIVAVYLRFYDESRTCLNPYPKYTNLIEMRGTKTWKLFQNQFTSPAGTASMEVWVHTYDRSKCVADLDEVAVSELVATGSPSVKNKPIPDSALSLRNGGFENGMDGWDLKSDPGMTQMSEDAASEGRNGLLVDDQSDKKGSSCVSEKFPVRENREYKLSWKERTISGSGVAVYLRLYDASGKPLNPDKDYATIYGPTWHERTLNVFSYPGAASADVWIHSFSRDKVKACYDDFRIEEIDPETATRPWKPQYKIRPDEKERLTEADLPGPDGIVYPDFRYAGVRGGIPSPSKKRSLSAKPETDIADILEREANELGKNGGGAIVIGEGTYFLDRPIQVNVGGVVIRGSGVDKTKILFRYQIPKGKVEFYRKKENDIVGKNGLLEIRANPDGLEMMSLSADGVSLGKKTRASHWGNTFTFWFSMPEVLKKLGPGSHLFSAELGYTGGERVSEKMSLELRDEFVGEETPNTAGAITFNGVFYNYQDPPVKLVADALRGQRTLMLPQGHPFKVGDVLRLEAPATPRWNKIIKNAAPWGIYRENQLKVLAVEGGRLTVSQPHRIDFPVEDGAYVQRVVPLEGCGLEDLSFEQTENLWIVSALFNETWNSWVKNVKFQKCGRYPFYFQNSKHAEVRDVVVDDCWFKGDGGTAYVGFERSYDCLIDNIRTTRMRHAPNFNWSCSGCVIRNGVFEGSDAQWHAGWSHENLIENCVIVSGQEGGGYGYGIFTTAPEDNAHGPIGPRNVIYNCDISSPKDGLVLSGMNENWLILHNRFAVKKGRAIYARESSFDHIIRGNVFCLEDAVTPAIFLCSAACVGVEITDNRFFGAVGDAAVGGRAPQVSQNNPVAAYELAPRPKPSVPSIYEWQLKNHPLGQTLSQSNDRE